MSQEKKSPNFWIVLFTRGRYANGGIGAAGRPGAGSGEKFLQGFQFSEINFRSTDIPVTGFRREANQIRGTAIT